LSEKRSTRRYRLKEDEEEFLFEYRRIKDEAKEAGINPNDVKHGWLKTKESSLFFKNPGYKKDEENKFII